LEFEKTFIEGLILVKPDFFPDKRGYFFETYNRKKYIEGGIDQTFVQDNISKSIKNTLRGLHYQVGDYAQGKLCSVITGIVQDIAVDIRFGSPTFGKYFAVELSDENKFQLWIPPGFAHGFAVISNTAIFNYKCSALYSRQDERSIIFNDSHINIDWKVENPIVKEKDLRAKKFSEIERDFIFSTKNI
jgi:dTDP-4-dehydrorhamnose 3,5-epimerase